jgi:hypothetical protein
VTSAEGADGQVTTETVTAAAAVADLLAAWVPAANALSSRFDRPSPDAPAAEPRSSR